MTQAVRTPDCVAVPVEPPITPIAPNHAPQDVPAGALEAAGTIH